MRLGGPRVSGSQQIMSCQLGLCWPRGDAWLPALAEASGQVWHGHPSTLPAAARAFVEAPGSGGVHTGRTPAMPRFRVARPGSERPDREGRLSHASPELRAPLVSWRGQEATSAQARVSCAAVQPSLTHTVPGSNDRALPGAAHRAGMWCSVQTPSHTQKVGASEAGESGSAGLGCRNKHPPNLSGYTQQKFLSCRHFPTTGLLHSVTQGPGPGGAPHLVAPRLEQGAFLVTNIGEETTGKLVLQPRGTPSLQISAHWPEIQRRWKRETQMSRLA